MKQVDYNTGYALRDLYEGRIDARTLIEYDDGYYVVRLWGNPIARYNGSKLEIDTCGYYTLTTVNRLNGILNIFSGETIKCKGGKFFIDGEEWDGCTKVIKI